MPAGLGGGLSLAKNTSSHSGRSSYHDYSKRALFLFGKSP